MSRTPGLSPSRANDFAQCPHMYRLRVIDRVPEPPQRATTLGTLVHLVLERLFDVPAAQRDPDAAHALLEPAWDDLVADRPELAELVADAAERSQFFGDARARVSTYFIVENPTRLEPHGREVRLESSLDGGPAIRGVIDRIDRAPDGALRIIDYKSGKAPSSRYGEQADFQMKFYAMLVERTEGTRPALMRLLYLRDGGVKELVPTEADIAAVEAKVRSTWTAITMYAAAGAFPTSPSRLCAWCSFQTLCPEFGGTPPPLDPDAVERATGVRPESPETALP
ncbi:MAG TPA: PD-(D/E)XK nuclease family protein [Demequina sp.]|nr:PD-(D/E)XK nuclease family protein [Demequina sp.]